MKKVLLSVMCAGLLSASTMTATGKNALTLTAQQEESLVKSIIPSTKVEKIARGEVDGFYKAYLANGQILYINPFKRLIFVGEIYTSNGQNITANDRNQWQNELKNSQLKNLKKSKLTKGAAKEVFGKGSRKYEFVIFTDPECPYCKKAEKHFSQNDVTLHVNFLPLPFHKHAKDWSLQALSSKDFKKALKTIHETNKDLKVKITEKAKKQLDKMVALGKSLGITGTPKIFVVEKDTDKVVAIIDGANIPKINEYLKKDKQ